MFKLRLLVHYGQKVFNRTMTNLATCTCRVSFCSKSQPIDLFELSAVVFFFIEASVLFQSCNSKIVYM